MSIFEKKQSTDSTTLEALVITNVITPLDLDEADEEFVIGELKWLFKATDHLLKICRDEVERSQPVPLPIPAEAETSSEADNRLLDKPKNTMFEDTKDWHGRIETPWQEQVERWVESQLRQINISLRNLEQLRTRETEMGAAAQSDVRLQNMIRNGQIQITSTLQEMAEFMNDAYGILIASPGQLVEYLEDQ